MTDQPEKPLEVSLPANVIVGKNSLIVGETAFKRFHSERQPGLELGDHCTMDEVHFALGKDGYVTVGNYCYFTSAILLCEREIRIGNYVVLGWNVTIADNDFHPVEPAERIADALACSPLGQGRPRPAIAREPVIIEDDVWVGPNATILKGVRIGSGAFIEPGALITHDIPARARVRGNPARVFGTV